LSPSVLHEEIKPSSNADTEADAVRDAKQCRDTSSMSMEDAEGLVAPTRSPDERVVPASKEKDEWECGNAHDTGTKSNTSPCLVDGTIITLAVVTDQYRRTTHSSSPAMLDGTAVRIRANA